MNRGVTTLFSVCAPDHASLFKTFSTREYTHSVAFGDVSVCTWEHVGLQHGCQVLERANLSSAIRLRSTDMQEKQTDMKTERKASLCSSAVQFVLTLSGALSSPLILMSSPGITLRRSASQ
ncbi:hypothetical protein KUCAC02_000930 [Chaenocephalus aceratus]|uniref:Uncharacterized protein n=1 Tax=Chaenocephalus aceratus TaxID=36190 RepID=A0ACB9XW86_CHAAC|nr:hypothetical protein KUCAC02_000930 [Chaenocephalus aceratus]